MMQSTSMDEFYTFYLRSFFQAKKNPCYEADDLDTKGLTVREKRIETAKSLGRVDALIKDQPMSEKDITNIIYSII